jgi:hypothetical protein
MTAHTSPKEELKLPHPTGAPAGLLLEEVDSAEVTPPLQVPLLDGDAIAKKNAEKAMAATKKIIKKKSGGPH